MRLRLISTLVVAAAALSPSLAAALDTPHDLADTNPACYYCHKLYTPVGPTGQDFNNACLDCHNRQARHFGNWDPTTQAVPGASGTSHSWSGAAANAALEVQTNLGYKLAKLVVNGNIQCVICHDPHTTAVAVNPATMYTSITPGVGVTTLTNIDGLAAGTATLTATIPSATPARGFRIKVLTSDATGGTFVISHNYGWDGASWLYWSGSAWVAQATGNGRPFTYGSAAAQDVDTDIAGVKVRFAKGATGATPGDYWDFFVAYPFLRMTNTSDAMCYACHGARQMNHTRARGDDRSYLPNGVRKFSHPVGVPLNVNNLGLDRVGAILDADGTSSADAQTDGNSTNNLVLNPNGTVGCTTCHAVHNADSNSKTVDAR